MAEKVFAYMRVSTTNHGQETARQRMVIEDWSHAHGITVDCWIEEFASGKDFATRPELNRLIEHLREGDTVIVSELSRLSRSVRHTLQMAEDVFLAKGVNLVSVKEGIDCSTVQGRFALSLFSALNQLEREQISERTKQALEAKKRRGVRLGRPEKDPEAVARALRLHAEGTLTIKEIEQATGVSKSVLYKNLHASRQEPSVD